MLRACTLDFQGSWDSHLPLVEFTYNNSYQATIGMAPYEALYGRKCRSPLYWNEVCEKKVLGLSSVHNVFHVSMVRKYVHDPSHIVNYKDLEINKDLTYEEGLESNLERMIYKLRNKDVALFRFNGDAMA
ncbi:hypothetical protein DH2020_044027 [Rehmannia glutinosa]|uniref:Uncharacterized protein n=1 Tax=Rehmannia glutinosa TaxID=99300 RepID=A0ABR0UJ76_REHGL